MSLCASLRDTASGSHDPSGSHGPSIAPGTPLTSLGFWLKARSEEQFLRIELGAESYLAYWRRIRMFVPFISRRAGLSERNPRG